VDDSVLDTYLDRAQTARRRFRENNPYELPLCLFLHWAADDLTDAGWITSDLDRLAFLQVGLALRQDSAPERSRLMVLINALRGDRWPSSTDLTASSPH
jgi:hypothetical protein